ncbi:MAG: hypothetical protein U9O90_07375 [Euryarchaeota archaeon]|nr:hypothetical protein [Euryarchaeota archaeon]
MMNWNKKWQKEQENLPLRIRNGKKILRVKGGGGGAASTHC